MAESPTAEKLRVLEKLTAESQDALNGKAAHWKCAEGLHLWRHGEELEPRLRHLLQASHMLDNGNFAAEQDAVRGARFAPSVVYVVGVDAD